MEANIMASTRILVRFLRSCFVAGAMLSLLPGFAAAQTFVSDSTFLDTDWVGTQFVTGTGGSSTGVQVVAGGNPGSFRNVTDVLNAATPGNSTIVLSTHIYTPFTYVPSVSGAIGSLNYIEDAACTAGCFGDGQSTGPAVLQGGNLYILSSSTFITGPGAPWTQHALSGLTAADFGLVNVTSPGSGTIFDNTQHPNFSAGGASIQFGFFRANGTSVGGGGYTLAAGIDNWQLAIFAGAPMGQTVVPVPALGNAELAALMALVALLGWACVRRVGGRRVRER
jgi:hypothetical protein